MTLIRSRKATGRRNNRTTQHSNLNKLQRLPVRLLVERLENRWLPSFTIVPLGTLGGATSQGYSINNAGQIVGRSDINAAGDDHAFLWENGVMIDLGTFPGGSSSIAWDINDMGQIVGESRTSAGVYEAAIWDINHNISSMGILPGAFLGSYAYAINNSGVAVGFSNLNSTINHGMRWDAVNGLRDLGVLPGGISSTAFDINNSGYIIGVSSTAQTLYISAYVPVGGNSFIELPNSKHVGAVGSTGQSVNDSGVITGKAKIHSAQGPHHIYRYENGAIEDLGAIPGAQRSSVPYKINNDGIIVGNSEVGGGQRHGIVFVNETMYDLNDLVSADTGIIVRDALSINDHGQIAAVCSYADLVDFGCLLQPDAVRLEVSSVASTSAGSPFNLTVTAYDMFGYTVPGYAGTVSFSSTDFGGNLPGTYSFTTNDDGTHTFSGLTLSSAGNQRIRVIDSANPALADSVEISVTNITANSLAVTIPTHAVAGVPTQITIMARDVFGNTDTNYNGTVHFFSSDPFAEIPGDTPLVNGVGTFTVTLKSAGFQNFIVNDTLETDVFGISGVVAVAPAAATSFVVTGTNVVRAGRTFTFTVQAVDAYDNATTNYTGTVALTSTDTNALISKPATLVNGVGYFSVTLRSAGNRTVTATDTNIPGISGTSQNVIVVPSNVVTYTVSAPPSTTAGVPFNVTVTARDVYGNVTTTYTGPIVFSSTDVQAALPAESSLTNGVGTFEVTLKTSGNHSVTVTHSASGAISSSAAVTVNSAATTGFKVTLPTIVKSGVPFTITVTAQDSFGNKVSTYPGTITFGSSDGSAVLPANSTLSGGTGTYSITMNTNGSHSITVTDTVNGVVSGNAATSVGATAPTAATSFNVSVPANATAGVPVTVTVTARNAGNNTASGYTGTVTFTSSDAQAHLPANATLTDGVGTFSVVFRTAGNRTIAATDTVNSGITGTSGVASVTAATAIRLSISAPATAVAGTAFSATVSAVDAYNNVVPSTIVGRISHTDVQGDVPGFVILTNGVGTISVTFKSAGVQSFIPKSAGTSITGIGTVIVSPAAVSKFRVTAPTEVGAGAAFNMTVAALDAYNNVVPTYSGTVHFTSTDGQAVLPANATLINGTKVFTVTLKSGDEQSITATDISNGSITGTSDLLVHPAAAVNLNVIAGGIAVAGTAFVFYVEALDAYGNVASDYTGVVHFTSSDGQAEVPFDATLTNGVGVHAIILKTSGARTIAATDTANASITGSAIVTVNPGDAVEFLVSGPSSSTAGDVLPITVAALDEFGNVATGYTGTITFSGSDYQATYPNDSTLTNGSAAFDITLGTSGVRNITVSDRTNDGIWGQASVTVNKGPVSKFVIVPPPLSPFVGQQFSLTVTARDDYENLITTYNGTVFFSSSDPNAILPPSGSVITNGLATFTLTMYKAQQQTVTATDTNDASITGTGMFPIKPGPPASLLVTGPTSVVAGAAFSIFVESKDQYGNKSPLYTGTVCFTSSDPAATLPACSTLFQGTKTFTGVVLNTLGGQTITAQDTANSSIKGRITLEVTGRSSPLPNLNGIVIRRAAPLGRVVQAEPPQAMDEIWSEHWLKYPVTSPTINDRASLSGTANAVTPAARIAAPHDDVLLITDIQPDSKAKKAAATSGRAVVNPLVRPAHILSDDLSAEE